MLQSQGSRVLPLASQWTFIVILLSSFVACTAYCQLANAQCESVLLPSDGLPTDFFGHPVALEGDLALVGALNDDSGLQSGSAYLFRRTLGTWVQEQELSGSSTTTLDAFGTAVSLMSPRALVGSYGDDDFGPNSGTAYVFLYTGLAWVEEAQLYASDAEPLDAFGYSVALIDDTSIAVGALKGDGVVDNSGCVYVFSHAAGMWQETQKLMAPDGETDDFFAYSIAASGDVLVVGAPHDDEMAINSGAMYVFRKSGPQWLFEQKLTTADGTTGDSLGVQVDVGGSWISGGSHPNDADGQDSGAVYMFHDSGTASGPWTQTQKLTPADGQAGNYFGSGVALEGSTLAVGATLGDGLTVDSGCVYLFTQNSPISWIEFQKLVSSGGLSPNYFGAGVAISGTLLIVGETGADYLGASSGAAYVFNVDDCHEFIRGDANTDGQWDIADPVSTLGYLFSSLPSNCQLAHDANDDEIVDIADAVFSLSALFSAGQWYAPPISCGLDSTPGTLTCSSSPPCQ